jgi:hypothetical protein
MAIAQTKAAAQLSNTAPQTQNDVPAQRPLPALRPLPGEQPDSFIRKSSTQWESQGVAEGLTEMDKSQTPPGRDTGPRSGPDQYVKPITSKQMQDRALDKLNRAAKDSHKKKDVKEAYPLGYSTDPAQGKWYQEGMDAVKYGTVGDSIKEIAKKHYVPPQWLEAFTAGFRQQEEWSREGAARGFPGGQKPEPYTTSKAKAMSVPSTFQPNTNARGGGGAASDVPSLPATTGGSGAWMFGLPVTAYNPNYQFPVSILNDGLGWYGAIANGNYKNSTSYFSIIHQNDTATTVWGGVTAGAPFSFGAGDTVTISGSYEAAKWLRVLRFGMDLAGKM